MAWSDELAAGVAVGTAYLGEAITYTPPTGDPTAVSAAIWMEAGEVYSSIENDSEGRVYTRRARVMIASTALADINVRSTITRDSTSEVWAITGSTTNKAAHLIDLGRDERVERSPRQYRR